MKISDKKRGIMKVYEIEKILNEKLQKDLAMSWDNVGLLIGAKKQRGESDSACSRVDRVRATRSNR